MQGALLVLSILILLALLADGVLGLLLLRSVRRSAQAARPPLPARQLRRRLAGLNQHLKQLTDQQRTLARAHAEGLTEVETFVDLRSLLDPPTTMPALEGWAARVPTLRALVTEVLDTRPGLVVECGSGGSSVWIGHALRRNGSGRLVSLEHDERYAAETRAQVSRHLLDDIVEVRLAPLAETKVGSDSFLWYDEAQVRDLTGVDLVFVDGPPGTTGPQARFPAVPVLREHCSAGARFLVDDAGRPDERQMTERWETEYGASTVASGQGANGWRLLALGS